MRPVLELLPNCNKVLHTSQLQQRVSNAFGAKHTHTHTHTHTRKHTHTTPTTITRFYKTTLLYPCTTTTVQARSKLPSHTIHNANTTPIAASTTYHLSSRKHVVACSPKHTYTHHASAQHSIKTREKRNVGNITPVTFCCSCVNMRSCAEVSYPSMNTVTH